MKLSKYEAILGKPWLDRWNPDISWKKNQLKWKVGSKVVELIGLQDPNKPPILSSIFDCGNYIEEISVQRMRRLAQKEPVYIALIRSVDITSEDQVVEINED